MREYFIQNKYFTWYRRIIERARGRGKLSNYVERHHIIPKCLGGINEDTNLVWLTYREHFLVHWLLIKCTEGVVKRKMYHALSWMVRGKQGRIVSSWQYELVKIALKKPLNEDHRRKISIGNKGKKRSPEVRAMISTQVRGRKQSKETIEKRIANRIANQRGKPRKKKTKEQCEAMGQARKGKKHTLEHCLNISLGLRGKKFSESHLENIAKAVAAKKGLPRSPGQLKAQQAATEAARLVSWNEEYRAKMTAVKSTPEYKEQLSKSIALKWQDPEYRAKMMADRADRKNRPYKKRKNS